MSVLRDVSEPLNPSPLIPTSFALLVDEKGWEHLGVTGEEFRRRWYAGEYNPDMGEMVAM